MTQATAGKGSARTALPIRVHDLLLSLAGRLDDDALAEARELVAATEVDRALEFIVGCLVAGPIAITADEQAQLHDLLVAAHCDPAVAARVPVSAAAGARHRFVSGRVDGVSPAEGVAEAAARVLDVLPDIRAVWAVWRTTPAGAVSGPVPHRVVLVGVGPGGFAPATAYRVQHALRRAGLTASVEVLREGADHSDYHHTAVRFATEVAADRAAPQLTAAPVVPVEPPAPVAPASVEVESPEGPSWMEQPAQPAPDSLNDHELDLLRQLQEELARREQADGGSTEPAAWQGDLSSANHPFDWHEANTMVNGVPLQPPDQRP